MPEKMYNLQIPISRELEIQLKKLAKKDERSLRVFCRLILEGYVKGDYKEAKGNTNKVEDDSIDFDFGSL